MNIKDDDNGFDIENFVRWCKVIGIIVIASLLTLTIYLFTS